MAATIRRVLIVGGGIGGMCAALALRRADISVDLVDIDPAWRALGAGLTLNGATLRALAVLDLAGAVAAGGHIHGGRRIHDSGGSVLMDEPAWRPCPDDVEGWGGILRPRLHAILSQETLGRGVSVTLGRTVIALDQHDDGVTARFDDGSAKEYDLVVGADGITSSVRAMILPDAPAPAFTGQGCWRAVFPRPADVETSQLYLDPGMKLGLNPVSDERMYMFLLEAAPGNPWRPAEEWREQLAERLRSYGGLPNRLADQLDDHAQVNYRPLETLLLAPPWHVGRVVLLGDAAHATTPHAGFGAGLAVEDGIVLADEIAANENVDAALHRYAERRYPRCRAIIETSLALGRLELARSDVMAQAALSAQLFTISREPFR